MAAEYFNSLGGYSVGIPPIQVVDSNGNVVTNVLTSGNVAANSIYSSHYYWANGVPLNLTPGGSNTQLQFNSNGTFGGIPTATYNGRILSLGDVSNLSIGGGEDGYVLQTDGTGNLSWTAQTGGGGGNGSPGGSNTQVQFNNAGSFGGDPGFTYNRNTNTLVVENTTISNVQAGNITVSGNVSASYYSGDGSQLTNVVANLANYIVQPSQPNITSLGTLVTLNVSGNASAQTFIGSGAGLTNIPAANIVGTVANASFATNAGSANTSNVATIANIANVATLANLATLANSATIANTANVAIFANTANVANTANLANFSIQSNISNTSNLANLANIANTANYANFANISNLASYVTQPVQSNITNVGILNGLVVSGNANISNSVNSDEVLTANLRVTRNANVSGKLVATGNVDFETSANINLGPLANIHIDGGTNGYVLSTDGAGNLSWSAAGGGGGGNPAGANTQVQFNRNGVFGATPNFTYNVVSNEVQIAGKLITDQLQMGSGNSHFSTTDVYFARTSSNTRGQVLYSVPIEGISGVEFHIIGTDMLAGARESTKISCIVFGTEVQYTEYAGLYTANGIGSFDVEYDAGNTIIPESVVLKVNPSSSNQITYKMLITVFSD